MLQIVIYLEIMSISVDYDAITDATNHVYSSANKSNDFDPCRLIIQLSGTFNHRSESLT